MWNFQRIICIWICCVSCMFGTTQLSSLVRAVPYEYFDDHEQSFYDLDSEQIQAKYDTRLLSQQMLQTQQQQQLHLENLNGFYTPNSGWNANEDGSTLKTRLKSHDGQTVDVGADTDDDDDERRGWLEETATRAAALTTTISETLDELHLPRAASCFTNGHKFTHGQKVPRLDNCEVCLCMDGEIFCWWEKCDKKSPKTLTTFGDHSTPIEESSTTRIQLNPKTTFKTTLKPMKKPKTSVDYKYDDDDSAEIRKMQQEFESVKDKLMPKEQQESEKHERFLNNQTVKKKMHLQQGDIKYNRKINEQNKNQQNKKKTEDKQQKRKQQKQHKNNEQHHHTHNHNNIKHDFSSSGSNSKILNFPENLPSVLYYDYKTEEHHQHQHQHREQHLKHQKQKQQQQQLLRQHEKELKHQHEKQQQEQKNHVNRHHEYGQDFNTHISSSSSSSSSKVDKTLSADKITGNNVEAETKHHTRSDGSSTTFKYFSNGNENIFNEDLQTDSDILPEPPTKKPKFFTSITGATTATEKTTPTSITQYNRFSTSMMMPTTEPGSDAKTTTITSALANTSPTASISSKKQMFLPWDYNRPNRDKTYSNDNNGNDDNNKNKQNESSEDILDTDDQDDDDDADDDAFHRWLTSTETNNKNNFTLNDAIIGRDDFGLEVAAAGDGVLDGNNNDYDVDERNYENMDLEMSTGRAAVKTVKPPFTMKGVTTTTAALYTLNTFEQEGGEAISNENIQKPENEQTFIGNKNNKSHSKGIIYGNDKSSSNNNNLPFSSNSFDMDGSHTSSRTTAGSTTSSNEENGVASVVNIDIMLTASSADLQQQPQDRNTKTTNQQRQLQLHEEQKLTHSPALISNTNNVDNNNSLYSIINDNNRNFSAGSNKRNKTNNVGDGLSVVERTQLHGNVGVNVSNSNNNANNNSANSQNLSSSSDNLRFNRITALASQTNSTAAVATPPSSSTTLGPERQCNVMGTLYKIGDVLPQDTGNCLQCICIDGSTSDDTPRVTCSPHNCPPLVLPDLFDATGY